MPCLDCPITGGPQLKLDNALNMKVDDTMFADLGRASNKLDCSQSEIIRRCIQLSLPTVVANPILIQLLPYQTEQSMKQ